MRRRNGIRVKLVQQIRLRYVVIAAGFLASVFIAVFAINFFDAKETLAFGGPKPDGASNSVLINFGGAACGASLSQSALSLYGNAQTLTPVTIFSLNTNSIGNVYSKFVAYNPLNNKIYVNNNDDGVNSKIYILDIGLPSAVTTPNIALSYTIYNHVLSQFEFDQLGDLYAIDYYNSSTGTASIGAYDDTTGILHSGSLKTLVFPPANKPDDLYSGDIVITPNGRLFCVFGSGTSRLYEITNYNRASAGNAIANYIGVVSKVCYGIAYDNGYIIMSGSNFSGNCYSFKYDMNDNVLSAETPSANNSLPIDMTSFSPSIGCAEKLISATRVNSNTYDLIYQIYIQNKGNAKIGNVQITSDWKSVFGATNIVSISASWISNGAQLSLNPSFNGNSNTDLLASGQILLNTPAARTNSTAQITMRVTGLLAKTYLSSAVASGRIGSGGNALDLKDSSNNNSSYLSWAISTDPDNNTVSDDPNENTPTPWSLPSALPVELINFTAKWNNGNGRLTWITASEINNDYFEVERSVNNSQFEKIAKIKGNGNSSVPRTYFYDDNEIRNGCNDIYYRLKQVDYNGEITSFDPVHLHKEQNKFQEEGIVLSPNPASEYTMVNYQGSNTSDNLHMDIYDLSGHKFNEYVIDQLPFYLPLSGLKTGIYLLSISNSGQIIGSKKLFVK